VDSGQRGVGLISPAFSHLLVPGRAGYALSLPAWHRERPKTSKTEVNPMQHAEIEAIFFQLIKELSIKAAKAR